MLILNANSIMKTLKKLKLNQTVLAAEELRQLKGGNDVINNNSVSTCVCDYSNKTRTINNNNSVSGCWCACSPY